MAISAKKESISIDSKRLTKAIAGMAGAMEKMGSAASVTGLLIRQGTQRIAESASRVRLRPVWFMHQSIKVTKVTRLRDGATKTVIYQEDC